MRSQGNHMDFVWTLVSADSIDKQEIEGVAKSRLVDIVRSGTDLPSLIRCLF
ncbi:MAG: hypothetical protein Q4D56_11435 [Bacteroides sp.]|nr:hypothetical protein [Bacteroides sp.]